MFLCECDSTCRRLVRSGPASVSSCQKTRLQNILSEMGIGYAHFELQGAIWFLIASLGCKTRPRFFFPPSVLLPSPNSLATDVTYDVMFGYLPLFCETAVCQQWRQRGDFAYITNVLTLVWASAYLFDSLLYLLALIVHDRDNRGRFVYWSAELGNILASMGYLASQLLYLHPDFQSTEISAVARIIVIQGAVYAGSLLLWVINAFQYVVVWRADVHQDPRPKRFFLCDVGFWAELFNIWPSLGYFGTSLWGLIVMFPEISAAAANTDPAAGLAALNTFYGANQTFQLLVNLAWDIGFCVSAGLYIGMWLRDMKYYGGGGGKYVEMSDDIKKETLLDKGTYY